MEEENLTIHDVLKNKGDYLFYKGNDLFLMENNSPKKIDFISLKPSDDWNEIKFNNNCHYVISFELSYSDLNEITGHRILNFLNNLKNRKIDFRVSRALPRNMFGAKHITIFNEFKIPTSCRNCLELYKITERGNTILCNGNILQRFRFTKKGRDQIYNYLTTYFGEKTIIKNKNIRFDFKLIENLNCTNQKREIKNKLIVLDFTAYWVSEVGWKPYIKLFNMLNEYKDVLNKGPLLDYGGAHGRDSFLIKRLGFDVVLADINDKFFKYTIEKQKEIGIYFPIITLDSKLLPFEDCYFAGVYSGGVMHHEMDINDVKNYLKESYRVLKQGGLFFGHVWAYWDFGAPSEPLLLQIRDVNKFELLLKEVGFNIIGEIKQGISLDEPHKHKWEFLCQK